MDIKEGGKYIILYISLNFGIQDNIKFLSIEPIGYLG